MIVPPDPIERSDEELMLLGLDYPAAAAMTNESISRVHAPYVIAGRLETAQMIRDARVNSQKEHNHATE